MKWTANWSKNSRGWATSRIKAVIRTNPEIIALQELPRACGGPFGTARFRQQPQDFIVNEELRVPEHATGAHWWLLIAKTSLNTRDVAKMLSCAGNARMRQIGYAGLKDKHALARQWFSLPIETLDPEELPARLPTGVELLEYKRARHAIRRGGLLGNRFEIRLRDFEGDREALDRGLACLADAIPNYFGEQRFGIECANLAKARDLFTGALGNAPRHERGLYLSAARSWLFNLVLARRVADGSWNCLLDGEAMQLDGNRSWFSASAETTDLAERLARADIHPSGPLVGLSEKGPTGACAQLEQQVLDQEPGLAEGLINLGMKAERRALRVIPRDLEHKWQGDDLRLSFALSKGSYATSLLRELVFTDNQAISEFRA